MPKSPLRARSWRCPLNDDEYRTLKLARAYSDETLPDLFRALLLEVIARHQANGQGQGNGKAAGRMKAGSVR
jgi:4-hydroxyphenylpyruvate dioxygenase-like putative hemolysin